MNFPNKKPTRLERALGLRTTILAIICEYGKWHRLSGGSFSFTADFAGLRVEYRTSFQWNYKSSPELIARSAKRDLGYRHSPYLLQVWSEHHSKPGDNVTVMKFEWDEDKGDLHLVKFLSGAWEHELAEFVAETIHAASSVVSRPLKRRNP